MRGFTMLLMGLLLLGARVAGEWESMQVEIRFGNCPNPSWAACMCVNGVCHSTGDVSSERTTILAGQVVKSFTTIYDLSAYEHVSWNGHLCEGELFTTVAQADCGSSPGSLRTLAYDFASCRLVISHNIGPSCLLRRALEDAWAAPAPPPHASASLRRTMLLARMLWRGGDVGQGGGGASVPLDIESLQQSSIISLSSTSMSEGGQYDALQSRGDDDCLGEAACAERLVAAIRVGHGGEGLAAAHAAYHALARAGVAVVLFLPPGALQEWRAAVRQGLLPTIDWLDEMMLVLTLPRGETGNGYPLWWVCKHLLTPHVVQGFDHVLPVDQLAQTGMLNIRHLLRTARRYTLDVAHPSVSHGRACYSGRLLERSGNLLRMTDFVEMLSPLFTINAWTKLHQLLLQPGYAPLIKSVLFGGEGRLGVVDSAQVTFMCKPRDQMASLAGVLEREAAVLLGERFPHAPQPSYEVLEEIRDADVGPVLDQGPPLAIKALEGSYRDMFQAKGGSKDGLRIVVDMGYAQDTALPLDQQWKLQEVNARQQHPADLVFVKSGRGGQGGNEEEVEYFAAREEGEEWLGGGSGEWVYLSPDAEEVMDRVEQGVTYVLGGMGAGGQQGESLRRGKGLGIKKVMRLPEGGGGKDGGGDLSVWRVLELLLAWKKQGEHEGGVQGWAGALRAVQDGAQDKGMMGRQSGLLGGGFAGGKCEGGYLRLVYGQMKRWRTHGIDRAMVDEASEMVATHDPCKEPGMRLLESAGLKCVDIRGGFRAQYINGTLHVEPLQRAYQSRRRNMIHLLFEAVSVGGLPDFDIVVNSGDHPLVHAERIGKASKDEWSQGPPPVMSIATTVNHSDVAWPCFSFWDWKEAGIGGWPQQADRMHDASRHRPFNQRIPQVFWRGSDNGKYVDQQDGRVRGKRKPLVELSETQPDLVNAQFTKSTSPLSHVPLVDHCRYQLLANLGGETYSARTKYLLACGSAVLQADDDYFEFFQPLMIADKHYVAVSRNLSDVVATATRLVTQPGEAEMVGRQGKEFARECLRMSDVYHYMREMLSAYSSALSYDVTQGHNSLPVRSHNDINRLF